MKNRTSWTIDEKIMVWVPTLFIAGFGFYSWRESRAEMIDVPVSINHSNSKDGAYDINRIEFSPDSQRIAVIYQGINGGVATVFDVQTHEQLADLQIPNVPIGNNASSAVIRDVCWVLDSAHIAGIYDDGTVGKTIIKTGYKPPTRFNAQHKIAAWNATNGEILWAQRYAKTSADTNFYLRPSIDGKTLLGQGTPAMRFDAATGAPLTPNNDSAPTGMFNDDGSLIAVMRKTKKSLEVRDVKTERVLWRSQRAFPRWAKNNVLYAFDYRAKNQQGLQSWDGNTRRVLPAPQSKNINEFALHPQRLLVAYAEVKMTKAPSPKVESSVVRVWDVATQKELWHQDMSGEINLSWSHNGRWLCAVERAGEFPQANLWVLDAQGEVKSQFGRSAVGVVEWAPDSKKLAIAELGQIEIVGVE